MWGHGGGEYVRRHSYIAHDGFGSRVAVLDHSLAVVSISYSLIASFGHVWIESEADRENVGRRPAPVSSLSSHEPRR